MSSGVSFPAFRLLLPFILASALYSCSGTEERDEGASAPEARNPEVDAALMLADSEKYAERELARARLSKLSETASQAIAAELESRTRSGRLGAGFGILIDVLGTSGAGAASGALVLLAKNAAAPLNFRIEAIYALRKIHDSGTMADLCDLCRDKASPEVLRVAAVGAVGDFASSKAACDVLVKVLAMGSERERTEAARCLLCFDSFELGQAFMPRFFDPCPRVRMLAVEYVRRKPSQRGIEQMRVTAKTDRDLKVAVAAGRAIDELE